MAEVLYSEADIKATEVLQQRIHNCSNQQQIDRLYEKMDVCDDTRACTILARKVRSLKQELR